MPLLDPTIKFVKLLLEAGADVNLPIENEPSVLHRSFANPEMMELLLAYNADVSAEDDDGNTPLHLATRVGNVKVVKMLLDRISSPAKTSRGEENEVGSRSGDGDMTATARQSKRRRRG